MFCTRLANGGLFPTGDPIVPFVISPQFECLNKPHTHTHVTVHMALVGYLIVFSIMAKCGQTIEFLLWGTIVLLNFLVGYHCSIVASTPQPTCMAYAFTQSCVRCILRTSYCSPLLFPLLLDLNFCRHLPLDLYTFFNRGHLLTITANRGHIVPLCYKSSVYPLDTLTYTHTEMIILPPSHLRRRR